MVVGMSLYSQIREAYISGESQRSIAKRLGISRQTVKKYCEGETMPGVRKDYLRAPSVVSPEVETFIRMCLEADKDEGLKKQTHTAKRIYDRLVSEMGFTGSYSIVRRVVHEIFAKNQIPAGITPTIDIIVLPKYKTVIFVNGCFWHGHEGCKYFVWPQNNAEFWKQKISGNISRDSKNYALLREQGWTVITIWECQLKKNCFQQTLSNLTITLRGTFAEGER